MKETLLTSSSFVNAVSELNETDQNAFLAAIMQYQLYGKVVKLSYNLKPLFACFKTQIDEYNNDKPTSGRKPKKNQQKPQRKSQ